MRHYKRKTEPVPWPQCPLYLREVGNGYRVICEAEPPAVRVSLAFGDSESWTAWLLQNCKSLQGYRNCWIYQETERKWADDEADHTAERQADKH